LISVTEEQAIVAMKSSTMQTIAAGKVPELAKVFSHMFGRSIAVKLDVIGKIQPQSIVAPSSPPPAPQPVPIVEPVVTPAPPPLPAPGEYLVDDDIEADNDDDLEASGASEPPATVVNLSLPLAATPQQPPSPALQNVLVETVVPPESLQVARVELVETDLVDFAEPPDSLDVDRAANNLELDPEEIDIDPSLQIATEKLVKLFNGEIIDRSHELFARIVGS
jgi:hypothetical protein